MSIQMRAPAILAAASWSSPRGLLLRLLGAAGISAARGGPAVWVVAAGTLHTERSHQDLSEVRVLRRAR